MRTIMLVVLLGTITFGYTLEYGKISTMDFVQIVDNNTEEGVFYYENNWMVLGDNAFEKNYIHSFEFFETLPKVEAPFQLRFITTNTDKEQYNLAEERFDRLIAEMESLRLMNQKGQVRSEKCWITNCPSFEMRKTY